MDDAAAEPAPQAAAHPPDRCPACGARHALVPGADALACGHCGAVTPIVTTRAIVAHDFAEARARVRRGPASGGAGGREVRCDHCGARSVTTLQARRCPFCDAPLVIDLPASADTIAPDGVVPFAIAKDAAAHAFQAWLHARWFAPRDLARRAARDELDGVYVPYWTFDADSLTHYTGSRGEHYWVEQAFTDREGRRQTRQVRKTRWHGAAGTVRLRFDDVLVCASRGLPRERVAQLEPWRLDGLRPYDPAYLAGFVAERYAIDVDDGWGAAQGVMEGRIAGAAQGVMEGRIAGAVRTDIGGDAQRIHSLDVRHRAVTFKHVLLPVWVSSYRYRGKVYRVLVNGQTRAVTGDRPWSAGKIALTIAAVALAIAALVWFAHARRPAPPPAPPPALGPPGAHAAGPGR